MSPPHQRSLRPPAWPAVQWGPLAALLLASVCTPASGARLRPVATHYGYGNLSASSGHFLVPPPPKCGVSLHADATSSRKQKCPDECPLWAETHGETFSCDFQCVGPTTADCYAVNPYATVPDLEKGVCRPCKVVGCTHCRPDGTDTCEKCTPAHILRDGVCISKARHGWWVTLGALALTFIIIFSWVVHLLVRPTTNEVGLKLGLESRSRSKLLMPACTNEAERRAMAAAAAAEAAELQMPAPMGNSKRTLWPLDTNLLKESVAGPGLMAHFNFQIATVFWALSVGLAWALLAAGVDGALLSLGTAERATPRGNCITVAAGWDTQHRLMWAKVHFVFGVYVFSSIAALAFSVRQLRQFQREDAKSSTHKDFCARCTGLPRLSGEEKVEEQLAEAVSLATGQEVVGVSICWEFRHYKWMIMEWVEEDLRLLSHMAKGNVRASRRSSVTGRLESAGFLRSFFCKMERAFISAPVQRFITRGRTGGQRDLRRAGLTRQYVREETNAATDTCGDSEEEASVEDVLKAMRTSDVAWVVFTTQTARDAAVETAGKGQVQFRGHKLNLTAADLEPSSVLWQNCEFPNILARLRRVCLGLLALLAALMAWLGVFFFPYAVHAVYFNYKFGMQPNVISSGFFSTIVVGGNLIMYVVCGEIANFFKFHSVDSREVCYMMMYTFACVTNVICDLIVTYFVAYSITVGINMRTHDGTPLAEISTFAERFQTFGMQRELGRELWSYAFPSTFLLPFILEPIGTIYVPYKVMRLIVRGNESFCGAYAESCLMASHMDLSRYGDIMLNVILAALIFFFPGGYTLPMFLALAVSHLWIYAYDHFRVLRCVQTFHFANMHVDWWAQWMISLPCGLLLSCVVLKANCEDGRPCYTNAQLLVRCLVAFCVHVFLHTIALIYVVPRFGIQGDLPSSTETYQECNKRLASSWFTSNPVFCLRSKHIYQHDPPCDFCAPGQEHLLRINPDIGQHFEDTPASAENYDMSVKQISKKITSQINESLGDGWWPGSARRASPPPAAI